MSDVIHHARPTTTQLDAAGQRAGFLAKINGHAEALRCAKVPTLIQCADAPTAPALPPKLETIDSISSRIAALSVELDTLIEKHEGMTWELMKQRSPRVEDIQLIVAKYYGFTRVELRSSRRDAATVYARHVAMFLAKRLTPRSYPDIGRRFGGKDHTTVMAAIRRIEAQRVTDSKLDGEIAYLFTAFPQAS